MPVLSLPQPSQQEKVLESSLVEVILKTLQKNAGPISFHDFMQMALYTPQLGYYTANKHKIGKKGDFITAPVLSLLFSHTFARQFATLLPKLGKQPVIIEFGAGTGHFAAECLCYLQKINQLPSSYYIIELSPDLRSMQQSLLQKTIPEYYNNIHWLESLPDKKCNAIVFANEVLDAMPVELFKYADNKISQLMVEYANGQFQLVENADIPERLLTAVKNINLKRYHMNTPYISEVNLWVYPWLKSLYQSLNTGIVFILDYGYHRDLYYSKDRSMGTLRCHYQHHAHNNPLINIGLQDITAHVDFTSVAESANRLGFEIDGYTTQGAFLSAAGIDVCWEAFRKTLDKKATLLHTQQLQRLLISDFAQSIKVMALSLNYDDIIEPFENIDNSYLL